MKERYIVVYTTFPDLRTAKRIVNALVENRLAACGNIFRLFSIYRWKKKVEKHPEYGALIKTRESGYRNVEEYIKNNHPYEVPEIIFWKMEGGQQKYLEWLNSTTARPRNMGSPGYSDKRTEC